MRHDPNSYLWDIRQAAQRINVLTAEITFEKYNADWTVSLLVERLFIIIGEAMTRLETHHPDIASQISDYRDIIGFRIILVHRYPEIRNREVWEIIQHKLPTLLHEVNTILKTD